MTDAASALSPSSEPLDLILRGGLVFDGTGAEPFAADVGVRDGRVAAVGELSEAASGRVVDVAGLYVAPGFIDIHTHSDLSVLYTPGMDSSLSQGVTTEVVGNCGFSLGLAQAGPDFALEQRGLARGGVELDWSTMDQFLRRIEDSGVAINLVTLAGHGTLRKRVMGLAARKPDAAELDGMRRDLAAALEAGAVGLSSGLEYVPGMYADVAELTELAKVAKAAGGFYATHLRDEGDHLEEAVQEALAVAEGAGIALQLSHHKSEKKPNWGKVERTLAMVDAARARGMDVLLDQYPYTAYQTGLATIALPPWAAMGTAQAMAEQLADPERRARVRDAMTPVDWAAVEVASYPQRREWQGSSLSELAAREGKDPRDLVLEILATAETFVSAAHFALSESDVERVMTDRRVMIGSDAVAISPTGPASDDRPHPRSYGTFARVLGRYVRDQGLLAWSEAIRKMTSLPASRLGWPDRGRVAVGAVADLVAFDPLRITDAATFAAPHALALGVEYVAVGGALAIDRGAPTGSRTGKVLRRSG